MLTEDPQPEVVEDSLGLTPDDWRSTSGDTELSVVTDTELGPLRVRRHPNSYRKALDWKLKVQRKWLMFMDSNISKFPDHDIVDLQIDSYPGANFRHLHTVLDKIDITDTVEKVIFAVGINTREQKPKETSIKNLRALLLEGARKFPRATFFSHAFFFLP